MFFLVCSYHSRWIPSSTAFDPLDLDHHLFLIFSLLLLLLLLLLLHQIDIPDPKGGPASLTLHATLPSSGYPSRRPPTEVSLVASHLSRDDAAAVAGSLASPERFVPGAVALFEWVEELRDREELFVVDNGEAEEASERGAAAGAGAAAERSESEEGSEEGDETDDGDSEEEKDPAPSPPPSFAPSSTSASSYTTVAAEHSETYEVKKSVFVATCFAIRNSKEAEQGIAARSDPGARHNCWAFVTPDGGDARSSDDGEPGGTAGRPILSSIAAAGGGEAGSGAEGKGGEASEAPSLRGVAVVVSRWRAGPKLGASGLARAYAHAARLCLSSSPRVTVEAESLVSIKGVPLSDLGKVFGCLERLGATNLGEEEEEEEKEEEEEDKDELSSSISRIFLSISVPKKELEALRSAVASATSGRARVAEKKGVK